MANNVETIRKLGCVVRLKQDMLHSNFSACGVLLDPKEGIILSHGSLFTDLCLKNKSLLHKVNAGRLISGSDLKDTHFEALVDFKWASYFVPVHFLKVSKTANHSLKNVSQPSNNSTAYVSLNCSLICAVRNEDFRRTVAKIMPEKDWTFSLDEATSENAVKNNSDNKTGDNHLTYNLLSYFLLLKLPLVGRKDVLSVNKVPMLSSLGCYTGDTAEIIATPFGDLNPSLFFNTYSRGVICNVSGLNNCWVLTDAHCIPGSEGAPLFSAKPDSSRNLAGIVAASLSWKNKEWVGFTLVCSIGSIVRTLGSLMESLHHNYSELMMLKELGSLTSEKSHYSTRATTDGLKNLCSSTVLVKVGSTWGSGVIINKEGVILTCSHVVKDSALYGIQIKPSPGSSYCKAEVVYKTTGTVEQPFDLAILKCSAAAASISDCVPVRMCGPKLGEKVYVVGHALLGPEHDLSPSVCAGVVSKIISIQGRISMVQSTCSVYPGASGGPLLNSDGDLIGIVVCNTVEKHSSIVYPQINMSVPVVTIWALLQSFLQTGCTDDLAALEVTDPRIKRLWALDDSDDSGKDENVPRSRL